MTDGQTEERPAGVLEATTQAGDIRARWAWVEPSVWTERMLMALEKGVKGGKWFSLIDKVYALAMSPTRDRKQASGTSSVTTTQLVLKAESFFLPEKLWKLMGRIIHHGPQQVSHL